MRGIARVLKAKDKREYLSFGKLALKFNRENDELIENKLVLQLGRSSSDLKKFKDMASPSFRDEDIRLHSGINAI